MADVEERKQDFERVSFLENIDNAIYNTRKQYAYMRLLHLTSFINQICFILNYSQLVFKLKQETVKLSM
jgi:hypothetical protein